MKLHGTPNLLALAALGAVLARSRSAAPLTFLEWIPSQVALFACVASAALVVAGSQASRRWMRLAGYAPFLLAGAVAIGKDPGWAAAAFALLVACSFEMAFSDGEQGHRAHALRLMAAVAALFALVVALPALGSALLPAWLARSLDLASVFPVFLLFVVAAGCAVGLLRLRGQEAPR